MDKIQHAIEWANKRLELQGKKLDESQIEALSFALRQSLSNDEVTVPLGDVTRLEIIDHKEMQGRVYVNWKEDNKIEASLQDKNKTLKIFISKRQ